MSIQARATQYGKLFGNWKIREFIGEGSHGKTGVFRIIKNYENFQDENALKVVTVLREDGWPEELTEQARREYEANKAALCAQAVNEVKLMNRLAGDPYVVSYQNWEFCDWEESGQFGCDLLIQLPMLVTLKRLQKTEGYFSGEEIRRVGRDICKALIRCGDEGILHRDIKPANIFLSSNRKGNYMLGDFGISRIVEGGLSGASTSIGTPDYAAPEQFGPRYDSRVDIYSLGLTLYELANQNHLPFWKPGRSSAEAVTQRLSGSILPPPIQADPDLAQIILKACAFRPEDRYQTAAEFLAALDGVQSQSPLPPEPEPKPEEKGVSHPTVKKKKLWVGIVACCLVLLIVLGYWGNQSVGTAEPEHRYAFVVDGCSWTEAQSKAIEAGGQLACFETREEYEAVLRKLNSDDSKKIEYRIGARRETDGTKYYWVDSTDRMYGECLNDEDSYAAELWFPGEPSYYWNENSEEYLEICYDDDLKSWVWNDLADAVYGNDMTRYGYIIEYLDGVDLQIPEASFTKIS